MREATYSQTITLTSQETMWVDANKCNDEGPRGAWLSFIITNNTSNTITNALVTWSGFTGANASYFIAPHDLTRNFQTINIGGSVPVFYYVDYSDICNHPHGGGSLYDGYTANYTITVTSSAGTVSYNGTIVTKELLSASAAGMAVSSTISPANIYIGQTFKQTVTYNFGNNIDLFFQPNAEKDFPDGCFRLIKDSVSATTGSASGLLGISNHLYFPGSSTSSTSNSVTIVYTWLIVCSANNLILHPWAAAKSGSKYKYSGFGSTLSIGCINPYINYPGKPYCRTGTAAVNLIGLSGGTFASTSGLSINSNTGTVDLANSNTGTYTVTYSASDGYCNVSATTNITIVPLPSLNTSVTNVNCYGMSTGTATVTATSNYPPYTYRWSTNPVQTSSTANGIAAGTYTVTVSDNNNCVNLANVTITQPTALTANITEYSNVNTFTCTNGSATVAGSGGTPPYSYIWNSMPSQNTSTATNLPSGTYTATATDSHNCLSTTSIYIQPGEIPSTATWTAGAGNSDWDNPLNWSINAIPNSTINVIIPSIPEGGNIFPMVNISEASCYKLTIQSGARLTVSAGKTINIYSDFSNNGNSDLGEGTFVFRGCTKQTITGSNKFGNLIINTDSEVEPKGSTYISGILTVEKGNLKPTGGLTLISDTISTGIISGKGTGTITGNITQQRSLGSLRNFTSYWYISSPVGCTFRQITNNVNVVKWGAIYREYEWSNVWKYDETDTSQNPHPDGVWMNGWIAPSGINEEMQPMRGYAVYVNDDKTLVINGPPNNGTYTMPVTYSSSIEAGGDIWDDGWHLIGNPYPSPIDWEASEGWTKNNVANAIYYYESVGPYGGQYRSYINGIGVPSYVNGIVSTMQGFFIKSTGNGSISINNKARVDITKLRFIKKSGEKRQLIRLSICGKTNRDINDETVIYFTENAEEDFNPAMDAYKIIINTGKYFPNLYSVKKNKHKLSINSQPLIKFEPVSIPLSLKVPKAGDYTIKAIEINNLPPATEVYLSDIATGKLHNLQETSQYSFNVTSTITEGRFYLQIHPKAVTTRIENEEQSNPFLINTSEGKIIIVYNNSNNKNVKLNIYNLTGQLIIKDHRLKNSTNTYQLPEGCYIVNIISNTGVITKKIVVR